MTAGFSLGPVTSQAMVHVNMNFPHVKQVLDSNRKWLVVLITVTPLWHQRSHLNPAGQ